MSVKTPTITDTVSGLQQTAWSVGQKLCSPDSDTQPGLWGRQRGGVGRQAVCLAPPLPEPECPCLPSWLLGKSGPESGWSQADCQQLGDLYGAKEGVSDMPGCRKECWGCQARKPVPRLSGRGSWTGKGTGGTELSGESGAAFILQEY